MILTRVKSLFNAKTLLFLTLILVFWKFFTPGPRAANDFPYVYQENLKEGFSLPSMWYVRGGDGMGEYAGLTLWGWPIDFVVGLLARVGLNFEIIERLFFIIVLLVGILSITKLMKRCKLGNQAIFVSAFFYLTSTYFILLLDGGQILITLAYAYFPLAYLLAKDGVEGGVKRKIIAGLGVSVLGFLDIRFIYVLSLLLALSFFYEFIFIKDKLALLKNIFATGLITAVVYLGLNSFWLVPVVLVRSDALSDSFQRLTQTSDFLSFTTWKHGLLLLQPHWYKNTFGKVSGIRENLEFLVIPLLVFISPLLVYLNKSKTRKEKLRDVAFWILVALIGIFLVKGDNPPFANIYPWLYKNTPGFSLFRDSTKFFFLISLAYSVLLGYSVDALTKIFNWSVVIGRCSLKIFPLLFTTYFLLLIRPVWSNQMTGLLSDQLNQDEYFKVADVLKSDSGFGRVLWLPARPPLGYASINHPVNEGLRLLDARPFQIGVVGSYELFNFIREAEYVGELLNIAGVKYVSYPFPDRRREELKEDNIDYYNIFLHQLSNLSWIEKKITDSPVPLLKTKKDPDHFYVSENLFVVIGSDRIYSEFMRPRESRSGLTQTDFNLENNALMFAEEKPALSSDVLDYPNTKIILYGKDETDLILSMVSKDNFIFPADQLGMSPSTDPKKDGWWMRKTQDFLWWRNFLQQKYGLDYQEFDYGGGVAVAEGNREITLKSKNLKKEDMLYVRALNNKKGGVLEFWQGDRKLGDSVATNGECLDKIYLKLTGYADVPDKFFEYDCSFFFWIPVGKLVKNGELTIKASGDINVINALVSVSEEEFQRISSLVKGYKVYKWDVLSESDKANLFGNKNSAKVSYNRLSPTHYKVAVEGITSPATLIFSENFDPLWEVASAESANKGSYPLYSLVNGFYIDKSGVYDIYYSPQKYVLPGISLGLIFFALALTGAIFPKRKP